MSVSPVLFGRESALSELRAGLERAFDGRGQVALVSGEAGIGKSALAVAIAERAKERGAEVTWGSAWEFADAPPYFPLWSCLRALGIDVTGGEKHDEGHAFEIWESVVAALSRESQRAPQIWILEDLHAADLGTLDLLTFLAPPLRAIPAFVVATARAKDPRLTERMTQRLTRLARDGLDVRLEPLSDVDIANLTENVLGRAVPDPALRRLVELTGGNPLFVVECARAFKTAGGIEGSLGSLPTTVRQMVLDRTALLPSGTRQALACGAVLGREFSAALAARMLDSLPARVIDTLLPALRSGLIAETKPGQFIFKHALVRDAIEDALGAEERATLHGHAEAALGVLGDTADVLVERARHALSALMPGNEAQTLALADRATELLEREAAFDRACDLHIRIDEARRSGALPAAPAERKLHVAEVARAAGRSDVSRRLCEEVVAEARVSGDGELFARAALLHGADVRPGVIVRSQVALFEEARALLGERVPELGARVLARLATAMQPALDPNAPIAIAREAIMRVRATNDDEAILDVLDLAGWGLYAAPLRERIELSTELLERALRANDLPRAISAHGWLAFQHVEAGDFDGYQSDTDSLLVLSDEIGHPRHRWRALLLASGRATTSGQFAESDRYVTEVRELAALVDDPALGPSLALHEILRKRTQRKDHELGLALPKLESALEGLWEAPMFAAMLRAACWARTQNVEATRKELHIAGRRASTLREDPFFLALLSEAYALAGTDDERRGVRNLLKRVEQRDLFGGAMTFTYDGTVERVLGLLDASLGDLASAERQLSEAHRLALERGHAPWVAQTAYELGEVLKRAGREADARVMLEKSSSIARELGMTGLDRRASLNRETEERAALAFNRTGEIWTIERGSARAQVKDSRGMHLLARLIERPGEEIHVLALASEDGTSVVESSAGEMLDQTAIAAYRRRIAELDEGSRERRALESELKRALGLGGRPRQAGSATERARVNVQRRVKDAIARIAEVDAELGRLLEKSVTTGTFCRFCP